tara:strand:- start:421 stop:852 length:432 start_codon:yes stop_codon:yes gene_type:complete
MKLTYWYAQCPDDSDHYSIRTKTRKEAMQKWKEYGWDEDLKDHPYHSIEDYKPRKVTIEYDSGFDLMIECLEDGCGGWWEVGPAARAAAEAHDEEVKEREKKAAAAEHPEKGSAVDEFLTAAAKHLAGSGEFQPKFTEGEEAK